MILDTKIGIIIKSFSMASSFNENFNRESYNLLKIILLFDYSRYYICNNDITKERRRGRRGKMFHEILCYIVYSATYEKGLFSRDFVIEDVSTA